MSIYTKIKGIMRKKIRIYLVLTATILIFLCCAFSSMEDDYVIKIPEGMLLVDEGYYMMGAENGDLYAQDAAKPLHEIFTKPYYIDKFEVSNGDYAECVAAGACSAPQKTSSKTREQYYDSTAFSRFPVVNVTWQDAQNYCEYVDKRLPTEAEWEKAARGTEDSRRYSWGNGSPKIYYVNVTKSPGDTEMPNSYPKGNSPYGLADVMANVSEWTSDWFAEDAYKTLTENENPGGPEDGTEKVVRGDSFETELSMLHLTNRSGMDPAAYSDTVGFRCVKDVKERVYYDSPPEDAQEFAYDRAYVRAGNESGIFLLENPGGGSDLTLIRVVPNGAIVDILGGPVQINYSAWYRVRTSDGWEGWTISSALSMIETDPE